MNMLQVFSVGDTIFGLCNGYFGRDEYDDKVCIMVRPKYAMFENDEGEGTVLAYDGGLDEETVAKLKVEEELDY